MVCEILQMCFSKIDCGDNIVKCYTSHVMYLLRHEKDCVRRLAIDQVMFFNIHHSSCHFSSQTQPKNQWDEKIKCTSKRHLSCTTILRSKHSMNIPISKNQMQESNPLLEIKITNYNQLTNCIATYVRKHAMHLFPDIDDRTMNYI